MTITPMNDNLLIELLDNVNKPQAEINPTKEWGVERNRAKIIAAGPKCTLKAGQLIIVNPYGILDISEAGSDTNSEFTIKESDVIATWTK